MHPEKVENLPLVDVEAVTDLIVKFHASIVSAGSDAIQCVEPNRERIDDVRLAAVTEHVRTWLFGE